VLYKCSLSGVIILTCAKVADGVIVKTAAEISSARKMLTVFFETMHQSYNRPRSQREAEHEDFKHGGFRLRRAASTISGGRGRRGERDKGR
jgi:hypothetical protein